MNQGGCYVVSVVKEVGGKRGEIAAIPLFAGLSEVQYDGLVRISEERRYAKGETIFSEGWEARGFYCLLSGKVKVFKLSAEGKEHILQVFGPGEPFGEAAAFAGGRFPANAEALLDCQTLYFPRSAFVDLVARDPTLALNMLAVLSQRLHSFAATIEALSLKEVPARLAAYLLSVSHRHGGVDEVKLDIAKHQLANLLGTTPETLSRVLGRMSQEGVIEVISSRIKVIDRNRLEELAEAHRRL